jgi:hypothetical protein
LVVIEWYPQKNVFVESQINIYSIATISEKWPGYKIEISPLRYMIETSGFFHCTHICSSNISERRSFKIFNRFADMYVQFDPKNWST